MVEDPKLEQVVVVDQAIGQNQGSFSNQEDKNIAKLRNPRKIASRISLGFFFFCVLNQSLAGIIAVPIFADIAQTEIGAGVIGVLLSYAIPLPLLCLYYKFFVPKDTVKPEPARPRKSFGVSTFFLTLIVTIGLSFIAVAVTNAGLSALSGLIGFENENKVENIIHETSLLGMILFVCVAPAILEEIVNRYLPRLRMNGSGDLIFIVFSGFLFMLFHMNFAQLYTFVIGAVLAWSYIQTNNILVPIALHFINNFLSAIFLVAWQVTGQNIEAPVYIVLAIASVIILIVKRKEIIAGLRPPVEPGWGKKAPQVAPGQKQASAASVLFLNPGSIIFTLLWLIMGTSIFLAPIITS